jgi:hypothetical protein
MVLPGDDWQNVAVPDASSPASPATATQQQQSSNTDASGQHHDINQLALFCLLIFVIFLVKYATYFHLYIQHKLQKNWTSSS